MINEIKEALEKATPGQWIAEEHGWDNPAVLLAYEGDKVTQQIAEFGFKNETADAHLIASTPTYIRYLLDELEKANKEVEFWKQAAETQKYNNLAILREHTAMKEALEWYADHENHATQFGAFGLQAPPEVLADQGNRATEALSTLRV